MLQGITKVCCELLDLKDAVENICGDMHIKYLTFLRNNMLLACVQILKIGEVCELFEEARGTLNKNVKSEIWRSLDVLRL
ncbi:hypothetical protein DY000_02047602 [Brassica cretica]|uniref:Exocyst subunit Exo70 family protein n=1 Tax=Brassica cretica TaxID=69181 RepID=A0ABQ7ESU1_BRACR|nr:hypothetical protein DY000_02047602 [Brassica cretica]